MQQRKLKAINSNLISFDYKLASVVSSLRDLMEREKETKLVCVTVKLARGRFTERNGSTREKLESPAGWIVALRNVIRNK
ncbi:unnamed protein product [Dovyalis caffra]|uniref:Uncharacterized protein n=1 Tax=Dovyalis caffra TaxID=77055 RepID=A0AAV1RFC5_9ROSI|nr:unnamed protein product [Dovyalis caffra]